MSTSCAHRELLNVGDSPAADVCPLPQTDQLSDQPRICPGEYSSSRRQKLKLTSTDIHRHEIEMQ